MRRTLRLSSKAAPGNLYFRAASGNVAAEGKGFLVNDELLITIAGGRASIQNGELRVPIEFKNGTAQLGITYQWAE